MRCALISWPRLVRTAGVAVVALGVGLQLSHMRRQEAALRVESQGAALKSFTHGLNVVAVNTQAQPDAVVTLLNDFEAIRKMPAVSDVDTELMTALNQ